MLLGHIHVFNDDNYFKSRAIHIFGWDIGTLEKDSIERFYEKRDTIIYQWTYLKI